MNIKTYSELCSFNSFNDRFKYLKLSGIIGNETFGFDRYINQRFYNSQEWKHTRNFVILRDNGCDLGVDGYDIYGKIFIHHMNPIKPEDFKLNVDYILNPEYLISTTFETHNAIHYGNSNILSNIPVERKKNDTCPWKNNLGGAIWKVY